MKRLIKISAIATALIVAAVLGAAVYGHNFTDVNEYDEAIGTLASIGVIRGTTDTTYSPTADVTRWQMALLVTKLVTGDVDELIWYPADSDVGFTDIYPDHYRGSIAYAAKNGIIIGRSETEFAPNDGITAQDAATMLVRALGYPRADYDAGYPDSYIKEANNLGLFDGLNDVIFTKTLTRGQTAQMLYNTFTAVKRSGGTIAVDSFDYRDMRLALCATHTVSINGSVGITSSDELLTFCELNKDGSFGEAAFTLNPEIFGLQTLSEAQLNAILGKAWHIVATDSFKNVLSITESASRFFTDDLSVEAANSAYISIGNTDYTPVDEYSYILNDRVTPSKRQIIIYGLGEMFASTVPLKAADVFGSCAYYTLTAYDDNADGYYDRALYRPYGFGTYSNTKGAITVTGSSKHTIKEADVIVTGDLLPAENVCILYSFIPQSGELKILRAIPEQAGRIALYDSSEIAIYNTRQDDYTTYKLGNPSVSGAHNEQVAARIISTAGDSKISFRTCAVKYYLDGDRVLKLSIDEKDKSAVNIVKGDGYTSSKSCCIVQSIDTQYIEYGLAGLTVLASDGTTKFIYVLNYNGNTLNEELIPAIRPGDILEYAIRSDKYKLEDINGILTVYDVNQISDKPHATIGNYSAYKYYIGCESEYIGLGSKINDKGSIQYVAQVKTDEKTRVVVFDGLSIANITSEALVDGYERYTGGDYAMYVSLGSDGVADLVFFREIYKPVEIVLSNNYTTLVYFSPYSTRVDNYEANNGVITYKNVIDLLTGQRVEVYTEKLIEAGYYRAAVDVLGKIKLVSTTKVEESLANNFIEYRRDATITSISVTTGISPVYSVKIKETESVSRTYTVTNLIVYGPNSDKSDVVNFGDSDMNSLISRISDTDYCIADVFLKPSKNSDNTENMTIIIKLL